MGNSQCDEKQRHQTKEIIRFILILNLENLVSRSILVEVYPKNGEHQEKMIKRFFRKCKKQGILEEHIEKTSFFISKRQKKRSERRKREFENQRNSSEY